MTRRMLCPPAPGPLEDYAAQFDDLFPNLAQRRAFRAYLQGLLLPRERNKTLTGLAGTEPGVGTQAAPAQRLQWFLSESSWDAHALNTRRLALLCADPATRPHDGGVLILDETGDRKDGTHTWAWPHDGGSSATSVITGCPAASRDAIGVPHEGHRSERAPGLPPSPLTIPIRPHAAAVAAGDRASSDRRRPVSTA